MIDRGNGKMEVSVAGKIEWQAFSISAYKGQSVGVSVVNSRSSKYIPDTNANERAIYTVESDIPLIIKTGK